MLKVNKRYRIVRTAPLVSENQCLAGLEGVCLFVAPRCDIMKTPMGITHVPPSVEWAAYLQVPNKPRLIWVDSHDIIEEI